MRSKSAIAGTMVSPYTAKNVDDAIAHLERVLLLKGVTTVLGKNYWQKRVTQIATTQGLTPGQRARIARLPALLANMDVTKVVKHTENEMDQPCQC